MIKIEKQTAKAKLLEIDGVKFWIKNSYLRADGTLTPAGLKAFEKAQKGEGLANEVVIVCDIIKETEKAVLIANIGVKYKSNYGTVAQKGIWMPKVAFKEIGEKISIFPKYKKMLQEKVVEFLYSGSLSDRIQFWGN